MRKTLSQRWQISALSVFVLLILWEIGSYAELFAQGSLPTPTNILHQIWQDRLYYADHAYATICNASIGFLAGVVVAATLAALFTFIPLTQHLFGGFLTFLFSVPLVALVPIIGLVFEGNTPEILLAGLVGYYPLMESLILGLRRIRPDWADVIRVYGGNSWMIFRKIGIKFGLASLLIGMRIAAPGAVLGAMLGELAGAKRGLGYFLIASMQIANSARVWGICVVATSLTSIAYGVIAILGTRIERNLIDREPEVGGVYRRPAVNKRLSELKGPAILQVFLSIIMTLTIWELFVRSANLPYLVKGPVDVVRFLFNLSFEDKSSLFMAFGRTLLISFLGLLAGMIFALLLAVLLNLHPHFEPIVLPFALLSQTIPLIALTSIIVLTFGRDFIATLVITISVTFFPAFAIILQGLDRVPSNLVDLVKVYKDSELTVLVKVRFLSALPFTLAAARLVAPRVLMGVVLAEYLATNTGIGALLIAARGRSEFIVVWALAFLIAFTSICFHGMARWGERRLIRKYGFDLSEL